MEACCRSLVTKQFRRTIAKFRINLNHRNLLCRSCKHFGQKNFVKSLLMSTLDKVIYYVGTFYRAQQNYTK
jgi:hypothetical protein